MWERRLESMSLSAGSTRRPTDGRSVRRSISARRPIAAGYNVGGETSIDGVSQGNAADTLRLGAGMGARLWPGGDIVLNAESVVAKPQGEPAVRTSGQK